MSTIRFPNDDMVRKLMRRQDDFWRRLRKKQEAEREKKEKEAQSLEVVRK